MSSSPMRATVLVTCAGSVPGVAVIQALKRQQEMPIRVVAVDQNPWSAGCYLADARFTVPAADDPKLVPTVLQLCQEEHVQIVFPIIDEELPLFAQHRQTFEARGIRVITNEPDVVAMVRDKYRTYQACKAQGLAVPATWLPEELPRSAPPRFPLIVKPRQGRGTVNVFRASDQRALDFFLHAVPNPMVQEFIEGQEYTLDVLTDLQGRLLSIVPKERIETKAGVQVKGRTVRDERLLAYGQRVAELFRLAPRGNIQCIRRGDEVYLIEVNPKFPASLPLTVAAGVNAPLLLVKMCLGVPVSPMLGQFRDGLLMLRCWQELFIIPEDQGDRTAQPREPSS